MGLAKRPRRHLPRRTLTLLSRLVIGAVRARVLLQRAGLCKGRLTSDSCSVPVTVGWLHPRVILPSAWQSWSAAQLDAVLTHENEHVRRRDPFVQSLALLNRAAFWFHPLAWWIERQLSVLAEEACDAAVLASGHDPFEYSEYLMDLARAMQQAGARLNFAGMTMPGVSLPRRIRRILEDAPAAVYRTRVQRASPSLASRLQPCLRRVRWIPRMPRPKCRSYRSRREL